MIKVHAWYLVENVRKIDQNIFISLITILAKSEVFDDICKKKKKYLLGFMKLGFHISSATTNKRITQKETTDARTTSRILGIVWNFKPGKKIDNKELKKHGFKTQIGWKWIGN